MLAGKAHLRRSYAFAACAGETEAAHTRMAGEAGVSGRAGTALRPFSLMGLERSHQPEYKQRECFARRALRGRRAAGGRAVASGSLRAARPAGWMAMESCRHP